MQTIDRLLDTVDRQSKRVNSNSHRLVHRCGWVDEEERMRERRGVEKNSNVWVFTPLI